MNPIRAINTATTKGLNPDGMPSGTRAVDTLIHMAELHKLNKPAMDFVLAKYNTDRKGIFEATKRMKKMARAEATRRGWEYKKESTLNKAAILALFQHVYPKELGHTCQRCKGSGGVVKPCEVCDGTGYKSRPDVVYASFMDITSVAYRKTWADRVGLLYTLAGQWDSDLFKEWHRRMNLEQETL